jgi:DNA-binding transcriptional LysR family regulator
MNLQQLKTFRTVATLLNFNQAAKVLNYAQSTVSAQIKTLEEEIGVHLFERIGKRVALTEAGGKMLIYAQKLLAIEAEALADITGRRDPAGILTLRMPQTVATYHLPPILAEFQSLLPKIRLDVSSCAYHSLEHELQIGTVDLAFLLADSVQAVNLEAEVLGIGELVIVADPDSPLARKKDVNYRDLKAHPVFLPKADCGYRMIFEQALATEKIEPSAILEFNSIEAIKKCVMAGLGVTIIPKIAVEEEFKLGKLVQLDWDEDLEVALIMIWHKERWISPTLQLFMETVRRVMSAGGSPK